MGANIQPQVSKFGAMIRMFKSTYWSKESFGGRTIYFADDPRKMLV